MAINAAEQVVVTRRRMTFCACVPFAIMSTAIDREILLVVVEGRRVPSAGSVAGRTIGRELR